MHGIHQMSRTYMSLTYMSLTYMSLTDMSLTDMSLTGRLPVISHHQWPTVAIAAVESWLQTKEG